MTSSNVLALVGLVFLLIFFVLMFSQFSKINAEVKCPELFEAKENLGIGDYLSLLFNTKCSGLPIWFQALVYTPILIGIVRAILSVTA